MEQPTPEDERSSSGIADLARSASLEEDLTGDGCFCFGFWYTFVRNTNKFARNGKPPPPTITISEAGTEHGSAVHVSQTHQKVQDSGGVDSSDSKPSFNQNDLVKVLEVVERDSNAIADSFSSLFASLRLALSEATNSSVDHMHCFSDAAGHIQESVLDAATKGNQYINLCLRKFLRNVDALDTADNKLVRPP
ncbi:hypothetical protein EZV62_013656 [Acer yangbiense]|uniref:BLOC-1-related complex subunit 6 C-terminal helix domain-containing protein n=1 Tax=Acer yangbiense TaxID=1000413 RepID=A0A5C7HYN7_9ROSI|nr:hypothetical protein EZV62_013656 [Acer yangbiense]